jgi:hypothetical protein
LPWRASSSPADKVENCLDLLTEFVRAQTGTKLKARIRSDLQTWQAVAADERFRSITGGAASSLFRRRRAAESSSSDRPSELKRRDKANMNPQASGFTLIELMFVVGTYSSRSFASIAIPILISARLTAKQML